MQSKLVDAHTHHFNSAHRQILVLDPNQLPVTIPASLYSIGWHPWKANIFNPEILEKVLMQHASNPNFVALGELGLDRAANKRELDKHNNWQQQIHCLEWQLTFAIKHKFPRLVIHSVGAYSDILGMLKAHNFQGKILWHDFNGNDQMLSQLLTLNSFFSIGNNIFKSNCKIIKSIKHIPIDRLLFETDDQHHHTLAEIYTQAAKLLSLSQVKLIRSTNQSLDHFLA